MSSRQCRGGGGSSSGAIVILSSTPQVSHRNFRLTLRSSPLGAGSGGSIVIDRSIAMPLFHRMRPKKSPNPTQMMVEKAGMSTGYRALDTAAERRGLHRATGLGTMTA